MSGIEEVDLKPGMAEDEALQERSLVFPVRFENKEKIDGGREGWSNALLHEWITIRICSCKSFDGWCFESFVKR
jgi:hypothetical protein